MVYSGKIRPFIPAASTGLLQTPPLGTAHSIEGIPNGPRWDFPCRDPLFHRHRGDGKPLQASAGRGRLSLESLCPLWSLWDLAGQGWAEGAQSNPVSWDLYILLNVICDVRTCAVPCDAPCCAMGDTALTLSLMQCCGTTAPGHPKPCAWTPPSTPRPSSSALGAQPLHCSCQSWLSFRSWGLPGAPSHPPLPMGSSGVVSGYANRQ